MGMAKSPPWTENPWGHKQLDRNEHANMHMLFYFQLFIVCFSSFHMEKAMATHSSTLAWKIPWTEEPGRL